MRPIVIINERYCHIKLSFDFLTKASVQKVVYTYQMLASSTPELDRVTTQIKQY